MVLRWSTHVVGQGDGTESTDDPPADPFTGKLEPIMGQPVAGGEDLLRADQAEASETPSERARVPFDILDQFGDRQ